MFFINRLRLAWALTSTTRLRARVAELEAQKEALHQELEDGMYQTLGRITHSWAAIEHMIDLANWTIAQNRAEQEPFPVSLGRKIRFFRDAHNKDTRLAPLREAAGSLADEITAVGLKRHDLIHGFTKGTMRERTIVFHKHVVLKGNMNHLLFSDEVHVERADLFRLSKTIFALAERINDHSSAMVAALGPDEG